MSQALTLANNAAIMTMDAQGNLDLPINSGGTAAQTVTQAQTNLQVDPAGTALIMAIALG